MNTETREWLSEVIQIGDLEEVTQLINSHGLPADSYDFLLDAVQCKHLAITKLLLANGAEVNPITHDPRIKNISPPTPIYYAVWNRWLEVVEILLSKGAKIDAKYACDETLLCKAIKRNDADMVEVLLKRGANANGVKDFTGSLIQAIETERSLKIIEHFLNYGVDVNAMVSYRIKIVSDIWYSYSPLQLAFKKKRIELLLLLLNRSANINAVAPDVLTYALIVALQLGTCACFVQELLNRGADIHFVTSGGFTPLYFACQDGIKEIVETLLNNGANINDSKQYYLSPLYVAASGGHERIVKLLLDHFPNINISNDTFKIALIGNGIRYKEIVKTFIQYGTFTVNPEDGKKVELFHGAIDKECLEIVQQLLIYGANVNSISGLYFPLHVAINIKNTEITELLLNNGANINAHDLEGKTPIYYAVRNGKVEIIKLLQSKGALVKNRLELLINAVRNECFESVKILLLYPGNINAFDESERTALHFTSFSERNELNEFHSNDERFPDIVQSLNDNKRSDIARLLLSQGAHVDAQTKDGVTALHAASNYGLEKVVEVLLEFNADVNGCEKKATKLFNKMHNKNKNIGKMPLHFAVEKGYKKIVDLLLNKGADINAKDYRGSTAFKLAVEGRHVEVIKLLLYYSTSVDSEANSVNRWFHLFAEEGFYSEGIIETFLNHGAEIDYKNKWGETPLHVATSVEMAEALLENGADINILNKSNNSPLQNVKDEKRFASLGLFFTIRTSDASNLEIIRETFERHIVKMKFANLYVSDQNVQLINFQEMTDFQKECEEEIAIMKSKKINGSNCTFYDIIVANLNSLAILTSNDDIKAVLESTDLKIQFPIYACLLKSHFRRGIERKALLEKSHDFFHLVNKNSLISIELPYDCVEKIFTYLTNKDLKNVAELLKVKWSIFKDELK